MPPTVPRILPLGDERRARDGRRFAPLHVVSGGRHHIGWFELGGDAWTVGLTEAGAVADAGVPADEVRRRTRALLERLRRDRDAGEADVPAPVGPVDDPFRLAEDRRAAIARLEEELERI